MPMAEERRSRRLQVLQKLVQGHKETMTAVAKRDHTNSLSLSVVTGDTNEAGPAPVLDVAYTPTVYDVEG